MVMKWFEELPSQCPPADAVPAQGRFFRIAKGLPTESQDYLSQRSLQPDKVFIGEGIDECIVRSVSVFSNLDDAKRRLRLPKFRSQTIVAIDLEPSDGVIKKTFGPCHYSWWRSANFSFSKAVLAL